MERVDKQAAPKQQVETKAATEEAHKAAETYWQRVRANPVIKTLLEKLAKH